MARAARDVFLSVISTGRATHDLPTHHSSPTPAIRRHPGATNHHGRPDTEQSSSTAALSGTPASYVVYDPSALYACRPLVTPPMSIVTDNMRRAAASAAGATALLGALSGCAAFHSYFPSRDEVFKPVPVTLGEERVVGHDTTYVLTGRGYRVVTRDRDLLPDAKSSLDRASFAFRRFLAVEPPTVDVRLQVASRRNARSDSARRAAPAFADSGGRVVTMVAWREDRGRRGEPRTSGVSVPSVALARSWMSALTDSITHTTAPRVVAAATSDTGARADARRVADAGSAAAPDDPRIPDWLERAIPALVAGVPDPDVASAQLARQKDKLIPLRTLLATRHPDRVREPAAALAAGGRQERGDRDDDRGSIGGYAGSGREVGGGRRQGRMSGKLEGGALFDAEAVSLAAYLADREGSAFVGDVFRSLVAGGTFEDALRGAHSVAHDLDGFERGWRGWLDLEAGKVEDENRQ